MTSHPADSLPIAQRLALSYAPARARDACLTLFLLDNRLADIMRQRSEIIIAQMKLAWWRDRLSEDPRAWPQGEPLLARLQQWSAAPGDLLPLVNGWERLLADDLTASAMHEFAQGRALAWQALGAVSAGGGGAQHVQQAAHEWALADLALNLGTAEEAQAARTLALAGPWQAKALPRAVRPLAVLRGLSRRALDRGSTEVLDGPGAALLALRIGLTGR
ncbi:hypothetical protein GCM10009127_20530 [Alteraurantiacibacter aestuarii]|uniref:hypothetical protein n=1 Tax=Alteraurantiacibacter aestuarii TaxID=650004 RepID=UPI0031DBA2EC